MLSDIQTLLPGHPWRDHIHYFDTIGSTNTYAKTLAAAGAPEGTTVIADHQTGGRGRLGRSFSSPAGMGIYLSVVLRPDCRPEALMHLTCATGVIVGDAIVRIGKPMPGIKWTNDLVLGKRKLGGILTEISVDPATGKVAWAIIGIGINCCQKDGNFPPEIQNIAISLGISPQDRPQLAVELIRALHQMRQHLFAEKAGYMEDFRHRCVTIGQQISILRADDVSHGTALSVDHDGGLLVRLTDGTLTTVTSGEVSIRGMYGYL